MCVRSMSNFKPGKFGQVVAEEKYGAVFQTDSGDWGHVAYVISVNELTGDWTISEMNAPTLNVVSTRTFSKEAASSYKFIHGKIGAPEWTPTPLLPIPPYNSGL